MRTYICKVEFDNGATIEDKILLVVADSPMEADRTCHKILCKHNDDYIPVIKMEVIELHNGSGAVIESDEYL